MRPIQIAALCAALAFPGIAHAQIKKVEGASGAGLCASSLEFVAGARQAAGVAQPSELVSLQRTRDLFLGLPHHQPGEVEAYANAWSERMQRDLGNATTEERKDTVANEIATIAKKCQDSMIREYNAARAAQAQQQPGTVETIPTQPLNTQPLIITPQ